jgi:formylglycine-generating enzyme required for sulfatase activity
MARIFVSYSRSDRPFLDTFLPLIRRVYGQDSLWFDDDIHGGSDWWGMILNEIGDCDLFIYLISNESLESPYCQSELREALRLHKQILPVVVRRLNPAYPGAVEDDLAVVLRKTQYVDLTKIQDSGSIANLYAAINRLLNQSDAQPVLPQVSQPIAQPPVPDRKKVGFNRSRGILIALITGVIVLIAIVLIAVVSNQTPPLVTPGAQPTTAVAQISTEIPATTVAPMDTPTPTETLEIAFIVQTLDAQATIEQATLNAQATAAARATEYALGTQSIIDQTATATQWTKTPTPNITASIDAYRTQQAQTATEQYLQDLTATADAWTDTPTPTSTLTPDPLQVALLHARTPVTANADWTPFEQDFEGVTMVLVPAGCFDMGSEDGQEDERPVHEICFNQPFWIDKYEVTNAQFAQNNGVAANESRWTDANRPRERINWFEARDFCEVRRGHGMRLPTEAEWEYAARGPDNLVYPWGNEFVADNAVYRENSNEQTAEVGSQPAGASWVGAIDMSGNVWEWVSSLSMDYPYDDDHEDAQNSTNVRVLRGGSWVNDDSNLRAADRGRFFPDDWVDYIGFRCARPCKTRLRYRVFTDARGG